jgi:hypothetical protein
MRRASCSTNCKLRSLVSIDSPYYDLSSDVSIVIVKVLVLTSMYVITAYGPNYRMILYFHFFTATRLNDEFLSGSFFPALRSRCSRLPSWASNESLHERSTLRARQRRDGFASTYTQVEVDERLGRPALGCPPETQRKSIAR